MNYEDPVEVFAFIVLFLAWMAAFFIFGVWLIDKHFDKERAKIIKRHEYMRLKNSWEIRQIWKRK